MELKGAMGGIYRLTEWITRLAYSNILWLVCSSPFIFILVFKMIMIGSGVGTTDESLSLNWLMAILAPFTLFPATSALFAVVRKWVMGDTDIKTFSTYFRGYKENYVQSMIGGLFYTFLLVIMYIDYTIYMTQLQNLQLVGIIMLVFLIVVFVSLFNFFSMVAHYHMKIFQLIKNAILLTLIKPFRIISTVLGTGVVLWIGTKYPALFMFFGGSTIALWAFFNFYGSFLKMQEQAEKQRLLQEEAEGNQQEQGMVEDDQTELAQSSKADFVEESDQEKNGK